MPERVERRVPGGLLVAFEGVDGAGKTTQARLTRERLEALGYEAVLLREPSDGEIGRRIRALMSGQGQRPSPEEEFRLFLADREDDVRRNIRPALERGAVVLIDRYYISSMAYQGARGLDPETIRRENEKIAPRPHLTLLFQTSLTESLNRINFRNQSTENVNPFEIVPYQERVHELFFHHPEFSPDNFPGLIRIDASQSPEEVAKQVIGLVREAAERHLHS